MNTTVASLLVHLRRARALAFGGDRGGLTVPCHGCSDSSPHDGHLARGALTYLARTSR